MIDIHTHILPFVDDGSNSIRDSITLLKTACSQGVEAVILTPHHRPPHLKSKERIIKHFERFSKQVQDEGIPIKLFLGQEVHVQNQATKLFKSGEVLCIANTNYCLVEFDFSTYCDIPEAVYELRNAGYVPIVAHLERYAYATIEDAFEIKRLGGLIQVNAESLIGGIFNRGKIYRKANQLFREECVDFVASDSHVVRKYNMDKAGEIVKKKYGINAYNCVFNLKAKEMLKGQL